MSIYKRLAKREQALREIASMPNDSLGWRQLRSDKAKEELESLEGDDVLVYIRDTSDDGAELCVSDAGGKFIAYKLSSGMLANIAKKAVSILAKREFRRETDISE